MTETLKIIAGGRTFLAFKQTEKQVKQNSNDFIDQRSTCLRNYFLWDYLKAAMG